MDKYEWLPTESAFKNFPMEIIKADLIFSDSSSIYVPEGKIINNGWGKTGSIHLVGRRLKKVPDKLAISWFSYIEDKFYDGTFKLPYDEMSRLFQNGIVSPTSGEKVTYNRIIIGLAPEGGVSLWLAAKGIVLEVATFRSDEKEMPWTSLLDNEKVTRDDYIEEVLEETLSAEQYRQYRNNGMRKGLWNEYLTQYQWGLEFTGSQPLVLWLKTYNGENEYLNLTKDKNKRKRRAVPVSIKVKWQNLEGKNYIATVTFDEQEIFEAFEKLSQGKAEHSLKLQLDINPTSPALDVLLRDDEFILKLEKCKFEIYKAK